ncbi:hypothetical protein CANARDRAFT_24974 [[Candida] arabinofermentans NRRL YB-2248]|uniref:Uncharacterized protein n=1 Tax=[Candida] arabinofermentans NRRL YB-2248 TaxID=983967 RepID=A0A1E4SVG5_9ASCO|nr:hypothetical protein CANARDRAFT_24974 [[Candida] arabinofermentans NRRL YB-2248]
MSEKIFTFAHDCTFNIVSAPCGILSLMVQLNNSNILGIGSSYGSSTICIKDAHIYYTDKNEFLLHGAGETNNLFKILIYNEPDSENIRVDFHKLQPSNENDDEKWKEMYNLDALGSPDSDNGVVELIDVYLDKLEASSNIPDLVLIGKIPDGCPKTIDTTTGILLFKELE